jgi:hypothetical protein
MEKNINYIKRSQKKKTIKIIGIKIKYKIKFIFEWRVKLKRKLIEQKDQKN